MLNSVIIPALTEDCAASRALRAEGISHRVVVMTDDQHYGRLLEDEWATGEGFTILEHDVIPWPGALAALEECDQEWCGYDYPLGRRGMLGGSLGCTRFSAALTSHHPEVPAAWRGCSWQRLDGKVIAAASSATGMSYHHPHLPPVAHLQDLHP